MPRFEDQVEIELRCFRRRECGGKPMERSGNLSLREAGKAGLGCTILAYECKTCFFRVAVTDEWSHPGAPELYEMDDEP